jgi:hypothetical protein
MMAQTMDSGHDHFREEDWVDFAREVGDPQHRARVAQHLETGCSECEQTFRLWAAVLSVADQATQAGPPESLLGRMKERFSLHRPKRLRERLADQAALVFDSFRQPMLAGMRASSGAVARQLLYKAGRYTIKLQVESGAGEERVSIVGQILDDLDPAGAMHDIAVLALREAGPWTARSRIPWESSISSHTPAAGCSSPSTSPRSAPSPSSHRGARGRVERAR